MAGTRVRLAACALSAGLLIPAGVAMPATSAMSGASVAAEENVTLEYAKAHAKPVVLQFGDVEATIYVVTTGVNELNHAREFVFYGELAMPHTAQELDIEEFEGHNYLPQEDNSVIVNGGLKSRIEWAPSHDKWMNRVFRSDSTLYSSRSSFSLKINGVEHSVDIPSKSAEIDTKPLERAINEHWNDYQAALTSGMEFDKASLDAYLAADQHARKAVESAKGADSSQQDAVDAERITLNEVAAALKPRAFDREAITQAISAADARLSSNGKDGTRLTEEAYNKIRDARDRAADIAATPDLETILVPHEGDPLVTHRDFVNAAAALNEALRNPATETYTRVDVAALEKAYDAAIARVPAEGKGFDKVSREALMEQIEHVRGVLAEPVYVSQEKVAEEVSALSRVVDGLVEVPLGDTFSIKVTYQHPMKDAVSPLIQEHFVDGSKNPLEEVLTVKDGQEVRMSLTSPIIKRFAGFTPSSFHLNSDDGSHKFVRVLTNSRGEQVVAFRAEAANHDAGGSLVIRYVEGKDLRVSNTVDTLPETPGAGSTAVSEGSEEVSQAPTSMGEKKNVAAKKRMLAHTGASVVLLGGVMAVILAGGLIALRIRRKN